MARYKGSRKPPGQKKPPLTHFLCLPLVTPDSRPHLEESLRYFRDAHAAGRDDSPELVVPGMHPKAIRAVGALHCTLGVMSLDKQKLEQAIETLQGLDRAVSSLERPVSPPLLNRSSEPLKINLTGLVSMHNPRNTSILYSAPADLSERLYPFCLEVQRQFADRGFLVPDDRQLKLHATIVNTIYAKGRTKRPPPKWKQKLREETPEPEAAPTTSTSGHGPFANAPLKIDATTILERFKEFVWAEGVVLDRIAICEMGAKKITDAAGKLIGEEYSEVASVKLPT
ncbi:hypothetical protein BAUCODRAFT_72788 [Baudoinia panamericana UAMH 10762]|uniref:A-kinase anchor protein 7-like phosphoesterase domain-containing protein n=1 Tax=Baudoinia panamericana (strain UAMH 10762) TaxID=717646 RepID=M2LLA7_BAUPA|nr:uncharacterized protein BAUCODRAFT_72788 [Baudoinia panamericana UAMH 10762]EMC95047.1 hypothetical protein BAUCODRAFT_72788 [Baudoinia panamericana UAMH 10762]